MLHHARASRLVVRSLSLHPLFVCVRMYLPAVLCCVLPPAVAAAYSATFTQSAVAPTPAASPFFGSDVSELDSPEPAAVAAAQAAPPAKRKPIRTYIDGCFDIMHSGHYNAIRQAKALTDILVVGVHSDEEIRKHKGPPVMNDEERLATVRACKWVDEGTKTPRTLRANEGCAVNKHARMRCFRCSSFSLWLLRCAPHLSASRVWHSL